MSIQERSLRIFGGEFLGRPSLSDIEMDQERWKTLGEVIEKLREDGFTISITSEPATDEWVVNICSDFGSTDETQRHENVLHALLKCARGGNNDRACF